VNDKTGLKQFFGRSSRPGTDNLQEGDFVPVEAYKAIWLTNDHARKVMGIESPAEKITRNNPPIPDDVSTELECLEKMMRAVNKHHRFGEVKLNVQKLILGDNFLRTDGQIILDYLDAERAKCMPPEEDGDMSEEAIEEIDDGKPSGDEDDQEKIDEGDDDDEHLFA
jgi:hypothetical protein